MRGWWLRILRMLRCGRSERDIDDELRFHVEMEADAHAREGVSRVEARRRALVAFGGEDRWREEVRAARGTAWLEDAIRDGRYALRALARAPGFAAAVLVTIALGVGATTAVFSVVRGVVWAPLPYPEADELVAIWLTNASRDVDEGMTSWPNFVDWRAEATTFERMSSVQPGTWALSGEGAPEEVRGAAVSRGFFELIGSPLALGRGFRDDETEGDFADVVVLGHELFVRRYGGDPSLVGRTIRIDDAVYRVVGVAAPGMAYPRGAELWVPQAFGVGRQWRDPRDRLWLEAIGRLGEGVELAAARIEMDAIAARLRQAYPEANRGMGVTLEPLHDSLVGDVRRPLFVLLAAVALVMLVAAVNVANLMLARGTARAKELAARLALGAGRGRIVRQVLTESMLLGAAGGGLGALFAAITVPALVATAPVDLPRLDEVGVDPATLLFALTIGLGASLFFGTIPALQAGRVDPARQLGEGARGSSRGGLRWLRGAFVASQFGLALLLLVGAGLLLRSFVNLRAVDPGFEPTGVLSVSLSLPSARYPDIDARSAFHEEIVGALQALPGVERAGTISSLFMTDLRTAGTIAIESEPERYRAMLDVPVVTDAVSRELFATLGMPILAGRGFDATDVPEATPVVVVNETFARLMFAGVDPVGRRFTWYRRGEESPPYWFTVVGVVADARRSGLDAPVRPSVFQPATQAPPSSMDVLVRADGDAAALAAAVREVVGRLDPALPITRERTLTAAVSGSLAQRSFVTSLLALFAASALALAAVGIFGVMAYLVGLRTREIGIRVALGAERARVLVDVVREGLLHAGAGLLAGSVGALALSRVIRSQLFEVEPTDPATFAAAALVLLVAAAAACVVPARRAARVDAVVALRGG